MNPRSPERRTEASDSRESQSQGPRIKEFNNTANPTLSGRVTLKAGLSMTANNMFNGMALKTQLVRYSSALEGKYSLNGLTATLNQDVTIDINPPLNLSGIRLTGRVEIPTDSTGQIRTSEVVENQDGTSRLIETVDSSSGSESNEQQLTPEQVAEYKIEESQSRSRGDRQDLASNILSDISEIFSSDQNFIQKLSAIITLLLDKIMGGSSSESSSNAESTDQTSGEQTQEQATEAVRREFNLEQHRQSSVFDLRLNPFSPDKASDLSTYLTYQAENEAVSNRLIIRPKSSNTRVPVGFPTKTLESFKSELTDADADTFRDSLSQPLAIESKPNNPGFVSLVSVMQRFLKVDSSNTSKRTEIANNIRSQYIQEGNPNSEIASKFLETFPTSG